MQAEQHAVPAPRPGINASLVKSTLVCGLGGLLFGFDTVVISGTTRDLQRQFHLPKSFTLHSIGFTVAIALIGTMIGAAFAGRLGDRLGRRDGLRWMALLYLLSALGCAFAWGWLPLIAARLLAGLAIGGSSVLGPMYIAEIAPPQWRGRLVGFFQIMIVTGILIAYLSNFLIVRASLGAAEWRWMLGVAALPAAVFLLLLFGIPRSPRWLVQQGRLDEARAALQSTGDPNVQQDLDEIAASLSAGGRREPLFRRQYRKPILLAVTLAVFNQLTGINAILYYMNDIFTRAGFSRNSGSLQAAIIGAANLVFTLLAMSVIDKLGRKTLLLVGSVGTAFCLAGAAAIFLTGRHEPWLLWMLIGFIAFFAFSQGAVIWVYISEIFPNAIRGKGQSLGTVANWTMDALISWSFPAVAALSSGYPFVFFAAMMVLQFFLVLFFFPETAGVSLEQMQRQLESA